MSTKRPDDGDSDSPLPQPGEPGYLSPEDVEHDWVKLRALVLADAAASSGAGGVATANLWTGPIREMPGRMLPSGCVEYFNGAIWLPASTHDVANLASMLGKALATRTIDFQREQGARVAAERRLAAANGLLLRSEAALDGYCATTRGGRRIQIEKTLIAELAAHLRGEVTAQPTRQPASDDGLYHWLFDSGHGSRCGISWPYNGASSTSLHPGTPPLEVSCPRCLATASAQSGRGNPPPLDPCSRQISASPWRTGRRVGRTIYANDALIGVMDTSALAAKAVAAVNCKSDSAAALVASRARVEKLKLGASRENDEICQALGSALHYPRFCDDQVNFPGATEANGVCVGDHVAASMATEAARRIGNLERRVEELTALVESAFVEAWGMGYGALGSPLQPDRRRDWINSAAYKALLASADGKADLK